MEQKFTQLIYLIRSTIHTFQYINNLICPNKRIHILNDNKKKYNNGK